VKRSGQEVPQSLQDMVAAIVSSDLTNFTKACHSK